LAAEAAGSGEESGSGRVRPANSAGAPANLVAGILGGNGLWSNGVEEYWGGRGKSEGRRDGGDVGDA
jgi:hypothetical protein